MPVAVVTDSTAYLPEGLTERYHVRVVPLHVTVADQARLEGVDLGPAELAEALGRRRPVRTSMATPAELAATYRHALDSGADGVVSVHLSGALSGTFESARAAADQVAPDRVRVVDSRSTAMGLGFAVLAAAIAAGAGADVRRAARVATEVAARTRTLFCLETLEWLRRGGRIGAAQALLGTALSIKPLLHVEDGRIVPLEKVRTSSRAEARLLDRAVEAAGDGPVAVAVHHLGTPERAERVAGQMRERLPRLRDCFVSEVGAVVGAHTGPGALGIVVLPGGL
ncbi:EDD domain protein, DegV family [Streptoalloteichus tenebrarius]|uniref:EDD domain protein, DegV family n=1 Tax=Streptoalloteichus tenebrarius (strain ATCC 17920 / DSM 40477 / JCM 4838 / CBS 697.72 / NBRC 16177 / NCIMB 11028 / NRRL B-12390 / A12253. 1 / ISP 5477) TaxID=1933 RepID=A0ABT1HXC9_STRSD|nr:DegV family protein [Streptoalloteichus tenebrarius]MCP2260151.1 EDD domain protein, DegV family [Streptoalloteichus tenebrarius]